MTFTIEAELPLGTYQGSAPDGRTEPMPSVARLHSALLCAAGFGPRAVYERDELRPCDTDEVALRWLEENPPDGVVIPEITVSKVDGVAYRDDGTLYKRPGTIVIKKLPKVPGTSVAVAGRFVWSWVAEPPSAVREALVALCGDVPYLGTTESPVRLRVSTDAPALTHELDRKAGLFTRRGIGISVGRPGRTAELAVAHARRMIEPRGPKDAYGSDEKSTSDEPPWDAVQQARYVPVAEPQADVPWPEVILLPLSKVVPREHRVRWVVAIHRALVKLLDDKAPPLVTGAYPDGTNRPANRLALHLLNADAPVVGAFDGAGALAVLVPAGVDAADIQVVSEAIDGLRTIRGPGGHLMRVTGAAKGVSGARFWKPRGPGQVRLWRTEPAAVPDIRGVRRPDWSFTDSALLSLGFVWKAQLPAAPGRGDAHYLRLAKAVTEAGASVLRTKVVRTTDVGAYAHRVNDSAVVRPYTALLSLGDLAGEQTIAAIGQARHLGGGLLMPYDVEEGTVLSAGEESAP